MKHWIRLLCLPLLAMVAGIASAQDVIEISTVDQLKEFRNAVNSGNGYAGKTVKLTADLDLSSETNWTPIGNLVAYPGQSFNGTFDGDNHVISNLTVNDNTPNYAVAALFGSVVNGTIKNLTVKNVNIQSTHYAGGIVAYTSNAPTIENCKVIGGTIKSTPEIVNGGYDNGDKVGGIMGYATAGSTINNCWVEGVTISAYRDFGGIVGFSAGNVTNNTVKDVTLQQDLTNGYKTPTPTTIGDIIGRDGGATLSNNTVIKSEYVAQIGETQYETVDAAVDAANAGDVIEVIKAGDYTLPNLSKNVTVEGAVDGVVFTHTTEGNVASIPNGASFKNVKFVFGNVNYHGFQHAGTINMENCTLDGKFFSYGDMNFTNCEFTQSVEDYNMWVYGAGNVVYDNCTFRNSAGGKLLHLYCEDANQQHKVTVKDCKFINNGSLSKAAINVKATSGSNVLQYELYLVGNNTTEGSFPTTVGEKDNADKTFILSPLAQVDDRKVSPDNIKVYEDGVLIYPVNYVAQIGETKYETLAAAVAAANAGDVIEVIKAGDYTLPNLSENVTVEGAVDGVVFTHTTEGNVASVPNGASFKNVKFVFGKVNYHGFQHAGTINMEGCTLDGLFISYGDMNFTNCEFTQPASDYHMWCYSGNVTYTGCTFTANKTGKFLNIYNEGLSTKYTVTVENCKFVNNVAANKAALNVKATSGAKLLQFDVIINNCTTEGNFPAESTSQALVVLNDVVQVDDRTADGVDNIKVWQDGVLIYPVNYVAQIGDVKYMTLQAALDAAEAADTENFVIELLADAELDITAWDGTKNPLSIGTVNTQSITINGNNHQLTFNQKNSDWNNVATMNDAQTKLVLNDLAISSAGYNNGPWNRHDINFNCAVELNNVTSDKALAFKNDATLKDVTITDNSGDIYAVWISPRGQKVDIDGLTINCGRGIKIDDEYSKTPYDATLNIANATFNTTKKSAILVKNGGETTINAGEGINIENAAADTVTPIWVDEDKAEEFYKVTVTGANVVPEKKESDYVACLMKGEQRWGYYKGTDALSRTIAQVEEGWSIKLHQTTTEAVEVNKPLVITKNGFTADNVTAGEGFVREETNDEIIIREASYVAQIGDVKYTTLAAAVEAVPADGTETTIVMIDNSDIVGNSGVTIPTTKNVKLDLNGKTVTLKVAESKGSQLITNNGTLTITDSSDEKNGKLTNAAAEGLDVGTWPTYNYATNIVTNSGNLSIEAGNIVSTANGSICYAVDNNSTSRDAILNVKGGYMTSVGTVVRQFCNSATNKNVVNISDGVIKTNGSAALWVQLPGSDATKAMKAELNVSGGTLSGNTYAFYDYSYGNAFTATQYNLSGGTFNGGIFSYGANVTISDGTYNSWVAIKQTAPSDVKVTGGKFADDVYTYGDNASEAFISGGIYATKTDDSKWTKLLAEGYEVVENTDEATKTAYPWAVKEKAEEVLVELIHGVPYPYPEGKECTTVTYKRTFESGEVDHYRSWYVPFDYTVSEEDLEKFKFYKIHMIAGSDQAGEVSDVTNINIYITKVEAGTKLVHNKPYVIVPKEALTDHVFTAENVDKVYAEENGSRLHVETAEFNYDFYGTYREYGASKPLDWYALNKNGSIAANKTTAAKLQSYVWALKVTPRNGEEEYGNISFSFVEGDETDQISTYNISEDNEIEGIYTVNGMKVEEPVKGVNIIRFMDGKTKKIYVK